MGWYVDHFDWLVLMIIFLFRFGCSWSKKEGRKKRKTARQKRWKTNAEIINDNFTQYKILLLLQKIALFLNQIIF